ncbi:MAG TPA: sigma-70 family RNA polymerase sigma factor [Verrucomicrobiales bacterium]|jgi:RNA polymerase sigma-70 factor (ECF subfamily)|nr:sigma-70 family RNA polymerase sigma factor [Verrucomicrobiales bacterium]
MPNSSPLRDRFLHHFLECESALRGFIASVMARPEDREDLLQEVALRLWHVYERYDVARPFTPWALGVAARRVKEEYRKSARRPLLLESGTVERLAAVFEQIAEEESGGDEHAALTQCLNSLPEASAALIRARYFKHEGIDALAASTGQTAAAVYQNLCRLRRRLADCVRQRLRGKNPLTEPARHVL